MIWRARVLSSVSEIKHTLYEGGVWIGAMYFAFALPKWQEFNLMLGVGGLLCVRMLFAMLDERRAEKRVDQEVNRYFGERYDRRDIDAT